MSWLLYTCDEGDDPISVWRQRANLTQAMLGKVDGRTRQGLNKAWQRLVGNPSRKAEGQVLKNFYEIVLVAEKFAPKNYSAMSDTDIHKAICSMQEENAVFPETVKYKLVMRKVQSLIDQKDWESLMGLIEPWGERVEWDPLQPKLLALADHSQVLTAWTKCVMDDLLMVWIDNGEGSVQNVQKVCTLCLQRANAVDLMDIDAQSAVILDESKCVFRALLALLEPKLDCDAEEIKECVKRVKAAAGKTRTSILTKVGVSIEAYPWWSAQLADYLSKTPTMAEHAPKIKAFLDSHQAGKVDMTKCAELTAMVRQLPQFEIILRKGCLQDLSKRLQALVGAYWSFCVDAKQQGIASHADLKQLEELMMEACSAFPMDSQIQENYSIIGNILVKSALTGLVDDVSSSLSTMASMTEEEFGAFVEAAKSLSNKLRSTSCGGTSVSDATTAQAKAWLETMQKLVCKQWTGVEVDAEGIQACLSCAVKVCSFVEMRDMTKVLEYISAGSCVGSLIKAIKDIQAGNASGELFEAAVSLQRKLADTVSDDIVKKSGQVAASLHGCYTGHKEAAKAFLQDQQAALVNSSKTTLQNAIDTLKEVHIGMTDGTSWLCNFKGKAWPELLAHAQETILASKGSEIKSAMDSTVEATQIKHAG
eukprot:6490863-Amphidinium_carterae.5